MPELNSGWVGSDTNRVVDVEDARAVTSALAMPGAGGLRPRAGFLPGPATPWRVTAASTPNTTVTVAAGQRLMDNNRGIFGYIAGTDSPITIDILTDNPSDPSNERYDLIVAQQRDAFYGDVDGSLAPNSDFVIRHIVGDPASSPTDPVVNGSPVYEVLARVHVAAGVTSIVQAAIDDERPQEWTVARGGILPVADADEQAAVDGYDGLATFRVDTEALYISNDGSDVLIGSGTQSDQVATHETRLDALDADTGWVNFTCSPGTDWLVLTAKYRKIGKVIWMFTEFRWTGAPITGAAGGGTGDKTMGTITPTGLRPSNYLTVGARTTDTSGTCDMETNGEIQLVAINSEGTIATNDFVRVSACFPSV